MDRLSLALNRTTQVLHAFLDVLRIEAPSEIERDAALWRFEFTFEAMWKAARYYLQAEEGIDVASPKSVIRSCREVGLFDVDETSGALVMADDRNLTSHTYDRELAREIFGRLPEHATLMEAWLSRMKRRLNHGTEG